MNIVPIMPASRGEITTIRQNSGVCCCPAPSRNSENHDLARVEDVLRIERALQRAILASERGAERTLVGREHLEAPGVVTRELGPSAREVKRGALHRACLGDQQRARVEVDGIMVS